MDKIEKLSAVSIERRLKHRVFDFITLDETGSTNDDAKVLAGQGAKEFTVITAERQTKGKGRLGRRFFSPQNTGLYFTVILRPELKPEDSLLITAAAAVSTASAIENTCGKECGIKWVNDIYLGSKKVCGILAEASLEPKNSKLEYVVLGIGINIAPPEGGFPSDITDIAACLYPDGGCPPDIRAPLLANLLDNFYELYKSLPQKGFLDEYRRRSILTGRDVTVIRGETSFPAHVASIDDDCRLIVKGQNGETFPLSGGEVSVRLK